MTIKSMTEENNIDFSQSETSKKAQQAILDMAKEWNKSEDTIHHAIKSYKDVIRIDSESSEAEQARAALLKIAEDWNKKGRKYAAMRLYKELAENQ